MKDVVSKGFVEKGIDSLENLIDKFTSKDKSKEKVREFFESLRRFIGLKTKTELNELKKEVSMDSKENLSDSKEGNTLIFGDSVGVGFSVASKKYGKLFEKYVKSGASSLKVHKFLKSFEGEMKGKSVVFMSGFNDLPEGKKGVDRALKSMSKNIALTKKRGGNPVVCSLYHTDYFRIENDDIDTYNSRLKEICEKEGVKFVDLDKHLSGKNLPDGLHLDAKGYDYAWQEIRKYI